MATVETFDVANGPLPAGFTVLVGTWAVVSNAAECADDDGATGYYVRRDGEGDLGSVDHWCEVTPVGTQTDGASNCGPSVRQRSGATTGYQFVTKFSNNCEIWRVNAGTENGPLVSFTAAVDSGDVCRLEIVGRMLRCKVNGTLVQFFADTNIADGQRTAMNGYNGNSSDLVRVDRWANGLMTELLAPYVVDWSAQATGTTTTLTPISPITPQAGDLVFAHCTSRDAAQTMSNPAGEGWASIQNPSQTGLEDRVFGKIWGLGGQTDDTTPTFSIGSGTAGWGVTLEIWRNPKHATAPWTSVASAVVASGSQSNASSTTVTCPSVAHVGNNVTVVRMASSADDNALGAPSTGILTYGGAAYDQTTGNDYAQASSVVEDTNLAANTGTSTFTEMLVGPDVSNGITLVLAIPATGTTVGAVSETDALVGATRTRSSAAPLVTEADALATAQRSISSSLAALPAEVDALAAASYSHSITSPVLVETDVLAPAARTSVRALGVLSETDAFAAAQATHVQVVAALGESDALLGVALSSSRPAGLLVETDALAAGLASRSVGLAALSEIDALATVLVSSSRATGALAENDALFALTAPDAVGMLAEADQLFAVDHQTTRPVLALTELDVFAPVARTVEQLAGLLVELDELIAVGSSSERLVGLLVEIDTLAGAIVVIDDARVSVGDLEQRWTASELLVRKVSAAALGQRVRPAVELSLKLRRADLGTRYDVDDLEAEL